MKTSLFARLTAIQGRIEGIADELQLVSETMEAQAEPSQDLQNQIGEAIEMLKEVVQHLSPMDDHSDQEVATCAVLPFRPNPSPISLVRDSP